MEKKIIINDQIKADKALVIGVEGEKIGVMSLDQAKYIAYGYEMDLVLVSDKTSVPIVKLASFDKIRYENQKRDQKKKHKSSQVKELRFSPNIGEHDINTRVKLAQKYLKKGDKIRVTVIMKGRENIYSHKAYEFVKRFALLVGREVEEPIQKMGNRVIGNLK